MVLSSQETLTLHDVDVDMSKSYNVFRGSVAQTVEQRTHKPLVTGSNPVAATNHPLRTRCRPVNYPLFSSISFIGPQ